MTAIMTNLTPSCDKTDKSDKTIAISNIDFLEAVFGNPTGHECTMLVSFKGDPHKAAKYKWYGHPWKTSELGLPDDANNYFSLSRFAPNEAGEYRRRKAQFHGLYAIMLDDVGTKVAMERLTLPPSWLLETSPGNYQVGYILSKPITNSKEADQLMNAIVNANLCDPGANGPTARLARLPVAINGKHDPAFHCRLETWEPEKRYSVQELVDGLQLEMVERKSKQNNYRTDVPHEDDDDQIWCPRPDENAVIAALKTRNLYKSPQGEGRHEITCPWVMEHTNCIDSGTAYFEPDDNYPIGGFKCMHGHCCNRNIRDLLTFLNVDFKSARMKPTIRVIKGEIHRIIDTAERELSTGKLYYQRGGLIVFVYTDPSSNETLIQPMTQPALVRALSGIATWEQFDKRCNKWVRVDPPPRHTTILFDSNSYRHLPIINGIARQPYLRTDGSLMKDAGYDASTGMFGVFDNRKFSIPDVPTRDDAISALKILTGLISEFCFATPEDRSAALSAILTGAIRPSLVHALMFHVCAHAVGSGKSYLCALITAFATPQRGTPTTFPADDEECRKLLLAELLRSPAVIEFDNLTSDILPHKTLCTALTSEHITGRILGLSKTATVNTRTLFLSSGNNVSPIKDMARRCITISLNPEVEIPATRSFKRPNLIAEILNERERYVAAAITIIRAWIIAGKPKIECKSLAGFGDWSDLCRQPLLWLGLADPAASIFEAIKEDPDRETLGRLLRAWSSVFGKTEAMVRDAVKRAMLAGFENQELSEILHDIAGERDTINNRKLGWWIKRHTGQIVDGLRFVKSNSEGSAERWRVESVSSVSSVSRDQEGENVTGEDEYRRVKDGE
jgi:hypothetical protein